MQVTHRQPHVAYRVHLGLPISGLIPQSEFRVPFKPQELKGFCNAAGDACFFRQETLEKWTLRERDWLIQICRIAHIGHQLRQAFRLSSFLIREEGQEKQGIGSLQTFGTWATSHCSKNSSIEYRHLPHKYSVTLLLKILLFSSFFKFSGTLL